MQKITAVLLAVVLGLSENGPDLTQEVTKQDKTEQTKIEQAVVAPTDLKTELPRLFRSNLRDGDVLAWLKSYTGQTEPKSAERYGPERVFWELRDYQGLTVELWYNGTDMEKITFTKETLIPKEIANNLVMDLGFAPLRLEREAQSETSGENKSYYSSSIEGIPVVVLIIVDEKGGSYISIKKVYGEI